MVTEQKQLDDNGGSEIVTDESGNKADLGESANEIILKTREQAFVTDTAKIPEAKRTIVYYNVQLFWRDEEGQERYGQQLLIQVEGTKFHIKNYMNRSLSGEVPEAKTSDEVYQVAWKALCEYYKKTRTPISSCTYSKFVF